MKLQSKVPQLWKSPRGWPGPTFRTCGDSHLLWSGMKRESAEEFLRRKPLLRSETLTPPWESTVEVLPSPLPCR